MNILEVKNLHSYIGLFHIIQGVSLHIPRGESLALLGRNGAGKTTLLKTIIGIVGKRDGSIKFMGEEIIHLPPHQIARKGIAYVPDVRRIFPNLTVEENLILATMKHKEENVEERLKLVYDLFPDLYKLRKLKGKNLSGGQQQMLNIARGIVSSNNKLLLVDEPTEGLSPLFVQRIKNAFIRMKEMGLSILIVEGKLSMVRDIAENYAIMSHGRVIAEGRMEELFENKKLIIEHLGISF